MYIDQVLDLLRPTVDILHFVQKQKRLLVVVRRLIESFLENILLEPFRRRQHRHSAALAKSGEFVDQFVELRAKNPARINAAIFD